VKNIPCIGLFGTCGGSKWRDDFIQVYDAAKIRYFNPQVSDWKPEYADIEADHLRRDEVILFPVTSETYGTGSLAETGFSILQAINSNANRYIVVMIAPDLDEHLKADEAAYKESLRARRLVAAHLKANPHPNVFIVDDLEAMLELSLELHNISFLLGRLAEKYKVA
jgi:hypothetical protein